MCVLKTLATKLPIPTLEDWNSEPRCLDAKMAFEKFHGKTITEAVQLFEENSLYYQEDVMFMPSRVFGNYLFAYATYLLFDAAAGDLDGANCFIALIDFKAQMQPAEIVPVWDEVSQILDRLASSQGFYGASPALYGSWFRDRCESIKQVMSSHSK